MIPSSFLKTSPPDFINRKRFLKRLRVTGQVRVGKEGAALQVKVVFSRLSTVRQWNQQAGSMTGRSSKSYY
jgi:hypothetical protein